MYKKDYSEVKSVPEAMRQEALLCVSLTSGDKSRSSAAAAPGDGHDDEEDAAVVVKTVGEE